MNCCSKCGRQVKQLRRSLCRNCYEHRRTRDHAYGCWESKFVDAEPVRLHVKALQAAGLGLRRVAELSGTDRSQLQNLMIGRSERGTPPSRQILRVDAEQLLALAIPGKLYRVAAPHQLVDAAETVQHLQALVAFGYSRSYLAARLGISASNAASLFRGDRQRVIAKLARRVDDLFQQLQLMPGPSATARIEAQRRGWPQQLVEAARQRADMERQQPQHDRAEQHMQQEVIMRQRRRQAEHRHQRASVHHKLVGGLPGSWVDDALCAQVDPEAFFPPFGGSTKQAKQVCAMCEVRQQCLDYSLKQGERYGVWGGKSERERRKMMRKTA